MPNEKDSDIELRVRQVISTEVTEYRAYLEQMLTQVKWSIGIIVIVAGSSFVYFVGKSSSDLNQLTATTQSQLSSVTTNANSQIDKVTTYAQAEMTRVESDVKDRTQLLVQKELITARIQDEMGSQLTKLLQQTMTSGDTEKAIKASVQAVVDSIVQGETRGQVQKTVDDLLKRFRDSDPVKAISTLPIGTIIPSMLPPDKFTQVVGDPKEFSPIESRWMLANGNSVIGSKYSLIYAEIVPDLRGMFLRGMNEGRKDGRQDPEERNAGGFQSDAFKAHNHGGGKHTHPTYTTGSATGDHTGAIFVVKGTQPPGYVGTHKDDGEMSEDVIKTEGGDETRPKNVAVYYYIRIN